MIPIIAFELPRSNGGSRRDCLRDRMTFKGSASCLLETRSGLISMDTLVG